jgi:superfamily II DNA helicase RecQ
MQIKIFSVPILGGEEVLETMNVFLRSKKILQTESKLVHENTQNYWCFCIRYIDDVKVQDKIESGKSIDYKEVLDDDSFERFVKFRNIRKQISEKDAVPAYVVFTNKELAELAKIENLTLQGMKAVQGVGDKKVEKYGSFFITNPTEKT